MELRKKEKTNKRYLLIILIGIFFFLLGTSFLIFNYYKQEKQDNIEQEKIEEFFEIEEQEEMQEEVKEEIKDDEETSSEVVQEENYIGILEIPKINLKKGLVDKNSPSNNVNKNIYTLKETTLPDERINSHIILASHSGNSYISYFKNLKKLDMKDKVYFYYKNVKYIYEISNKYEIDKTGTTELKITNKSDITLITCISGTNKQVVYVANLIDKVDY